MKEYKQVGREWPTLTEAQAILIAQNGHHVEAREVGYWGRFIPPRPIEVGDVLTASPSPYARVRPRTVRAILTNRDGERFVVCEIHDTGVIYSVPLKDVLYFHRESGGGCDSAEVSR